MIFMIMKKALIGGCGNLDGIHCWVWLRVWSIPVGHSEKLATIYDYSTCLHQV